MKHLIGYTDYLTEKYKYLPKFDNAGYRAATDLISQLRSKEYRKLSDEELEEFTRCMLDHFSADIPKHLQEGDVIESIADGLDDIEDTDDVFDIDIDLEDEEGRELDNDPEESGDYPDERARPPRITKKMRKAMTVKSKVVREMLGPDSQLRPVINKIFLKLQKEIKKEAAKQGVPIGNINLDKLTIKR